MSKEASRIMKKRLVALLGAVLMIATVVSGCTKMDPEQVIATVNEVDITLGVANFYARYQQAQIEAMYGGGNMWQQQGDGTNYEAAMKENILDNLIIMHILEMKQGEYSVSLSEDEKVKIAEVAQAFSSVNEEEAKEVISATEDTVERVLTLLTIESKMRTAMIADVDTEVLDSEAAQKGIEFVQFAFTSTDEEGMTTVVEEEGKAEFKEEAEQFAKEAKEAEDFAQLAQEHGLDILTETFDSESLHLTEVMLEAVDTLKEGEVSEVIETEEGYVIAKLVTLLDREATDIKKENIVITRQNEAYQALCEEWMEEADVQRNDSAWRSISFARQGITIKMEEEPEDSATVEGADTEEVVDTESTDTDTESQGNASIEIEDVATDVESDEAEVADTENAETEEEAAE